MFSTLTDRALHQIDVIQEFIKIHNLAMNSALAGNSPEFSSIDFKTYIASSCVTRLYAILENFVETLASDYLDSISELVRFSKLPEELKSEYRIGISHILNRIDNARYSHLTHENIVLWYHQAVSGKRRYRFVTEALTRHEQNFRLNIIENLFSRLHAKDLKGWLSRNKHINDLYPAHSLPYEQIQLELNNMVELRNDAAHGNLSNIEGLEILERYCEVVRGLIMSISSYLHKNLLMKKAEQRKIKKVGKVTETFGHNGAFILSTKKGVTLSTGMTLHFVGQHHCSSQPIDFIQVDNVDVNPISAPVSQYEIGLKCPDPVSKKLDVYVEIST